MSQFVIRAFEARDVGALAEGYAAALGRSDLRRVRARLEAALLGGGFGAVGVVAENPDGRITGHFGGARVPLIVDVARRFMLRLTGCFIAPLYRIGGRHSLFFNLVEAHAERVQASEDVALTAGVFAETDFWFLYLRAGFEPISTGLVFRREAGGAIDLGTPLVARPLDLNDTRDGAILSSAYATERTLELLRYRAGAAFGAPECWVVAQGGVPSAAVIARDDAERRVVVDWACPDGDAPAAEALLRAAQGTGSKPLDVPMWNPSAWTAATLLGLGFRARAADLGYFAARIHAKSLKRNALSTHWQVTAADAGLSPLAELGGGEYVSRPPWPGTCGARRAEFGGDGD